MRTDLEIAKDVVYWNAKLGRIRVRGPITREAAVLNVLERMVEKETRADKRIHDLQTKRRDKMVNADEIYGQYLKGEDLVGEVEVTIKTAGPQKVGEDEKIVLEFHELKKDLVVNKTNKDRIKQQLGTAETDDWIGKRITLVTEPVTYKGETNPAIRVKVPIATGAA